MRRLVGWTFTGLVAAGFVAGCAGTRVESRPQAAAQAQAPAAQQVEGPLQVRKFAAPPEAGAGMVWVAVVATEKGTFRFVLMEKQAPGTVANFIELSTSGYFDGLTFHRVEPGMLIQGGDPKGDGTGGPGYMIKAEFNELPHLPGAVGMARRQDPDSAGSQFYVCISPLHQLDGKYTVFGYVIDGMDVVGSIQKGDRIREVRVEEAKRDSLPASVPR